jgi:hypothetical protein
LHVLGIPEQQHPLLAADVDLFVFEPSTGELDRIAFDLKRALADVRGRHPQTTLAVAAAPGMARALRDRGLASYLDRFIDPPSALSRVDDLLARIPATTTLRLLPEDGGAAAAIAGAAALLRAWFPEGLVEVRDRHLYCGEDRRVPAFLNPRTLDLVAVTNSCPAPAVLTSDIPGVNGERLDIGGMSAFRVPGGSGDRFAEDVTVGAARALSVEEIIARHQAAAARQAASITSDIASGTLTLTFEAPGFVAPVTITSVTTIYRGTGIVDLRQADIRVNGVSFTAKDGVPKLPIIEPERAAAPPLAITLTDAYRYRLVRRETLNGRPCYVVAFEPGSTQGQTTASLFEGRAWIDVNTFALVQVDAAQTGLKGPIVASEQTDTFAPDAEGLWLLVRSDIRQTYEGASVRTPIHRLLLIDRHEINAADFTPRRAAAYASTDVMLRDTSSGLRYLKREAGSGKPNAGSGQPEAGSGERVVADPVTRIRTLAAGVIVDPNISVPLPFAGVSYVDFDFFKTGTQFSGFFGGSYGQLAFSAPSIAGSRWQLAGRAFAIATSYNDRSFVDGREQYDLDIRQRPAQASVWLLRPFTARASLRLEYDWDYNRFERADVTDRAFVVPADQNAHGVRAGLDLQRNGWQASLWGSHTVRLGWRAWGLPASRDDGAQHASFQRYGASLLKTQAVTPRVTTRVELTLVGGRNLDRFSRITFGTFDNRLHGYPSALIRYDRGAVLRTAASWSAARAVRLDGFADTAAVRDPAFGRRVRSYTGFGAAIEAPAPFGTLVAAEWSYGLQGIDTNGHRGTSVVRITAYKVF